MVRNRWEMGINVNECYKFPWFPIPGSSNGGKGIGVQLNKTWVIRSRLAQTKILLIKGHAYVRQLAKFFHPRQTSSDLFPPMFGKSKTADPSKNDSLLSL